MSILFWVVWPIVVIWAVYRVALWMD